jgi:hypothetical protein
MFALPTEDTKLNNGRQSSRSSDLVEFPGAMELISYFQKTADPLVTILTIPCQRPFVSFIV